MEQTNKDILISNLRTIPNWPIKGVNFRDVTTLFKSSQCVKIISDEMYNLYKDKGITKIVGIESRGFVMRLGSRNQTGRRNRALQKTRQGALRDHTGELCQRIRHRHH